MSDAAAVLKTIKDEDVKYVDFRFTDSRGKWHHIAQAVSTVDEGMLEEGIMFDGSSIAGWKDINDSDMTLMPDTASAVLDPFAAQTSLILFCDVVEPTTGEAYSRDPRSVGHRAEAYLKYTGIGDTVLFGPELEFFVFDDVRYEVSMNKTFYSIDSDEGSYVSGREYPDGNHGHRPAVKGGRSEEHTSELQSQAYLVCRLLLEKKKKTKNKQTKKKK